VADTVWADVNEHLGVLVDDSYPGRWISARVNDGTYHDKMWPGVDAWLHTRRGKRLYGYFAYLVWPRSEGACSWLEAVQTFRDSLSNRHRRRLVIMQDVEHWGRPDLIADFSNGLEAQRGHLVDWLHSLRPAWQRRGLLAGWYRDRDERRVIGYGNAGDLVTMASHVKWRSIILASFTSDEPTHPIHVGWQFTDHGRMPPWTSVDLNVAHVGPRRLAAVLGLGRLTWVLK